MRNQANLLRYYAKYKKHAEAEGALAEILAIADRLASEGPGGGDIDLERNRLFAQEGQAAAAYWKAVRSIVPAKKVEFKGRVRKGAVDPFNVMLNYGYGILYSRVMSVLVRTGLNVNIGFLHKPQAGKPALLFDFIEEFRPVAVDRVVISSVNLGKALGVEDGRLSSEARHELARAVVKRLQSETRYHGDSVPLQKVIEFQAQLLARHIEGRDVYKAFSMPW